MRGVIFVSLAVVVASMVVGASLVFAEEADVFSGLYAWVFMALLSVCFLVAVMTIVRERTL